MPRPLQLTAAAAALVVAALTTAGAVHATTRAPAPTPTASPTASAAPAEPTPAPATTPGETPTTTSAVAPGVTPAPTPRPRATLRRAGRAPEVKEQSYSMDWLVGAPGGAPVDNTVVIEDTLGHRLDAHDGDLLQAPDGLIYLYGTAYGCGFAVRTPAYCGVRVYTTPDLRTFTPAGAVGGQYAFNHLDGDWQALCSPPREYGCYRPHVIRRPSDGRYVMWVNTHGDGGYRVLVADEPAGPFVDTGVVPELAVTPPAGGLRYGDMDLTVDTAGTVYLSYTVIWPWDNAHDIVVEVLDPTATTGTGEHVVLDAMPGRRDLVEAPALFEAPNGTWHMVYSDPARPYLTTGSGVMDAPSPLGPWTAPRPLHADSCGGQPAGVWPVVGPSGATTWVYGSDRWVRNQPNQSRANNFYAPLTFTAGDDGTALSPLRCVGTWTLE